MEQFVVTRELLSALALKSYKLGLFLGQQRASPCAVDDEVSTKLLASYNEAFEACTSPENNRLKFLSFLLDSVAEDMLSMTDDELARQMGEQGIKDAADRMRRTFAEVERRLAAKDA